MTEAEVIKQLAALLKDLVEGPQGEIKEVQVTLAVTECLTEEELSICPTNTNRT